MTKSSLFFESWHDMFSPYLQKGYSDSAAIFSIPPYDQVPMISPHLIELSSDHEGGRKLLAQTATQLKQKLGKAGEYLNFVVEPRKNRGPLDQLVKESTGYEFDSEIRINFFSKQRPFHLPKGYRLEVGDFLNPQLFADYQRISKAVFPNVEAIIKKNRVFIKKYKRAAHTVIVYDSAGRPVATSCITYGTTHGFLFGGGVLKKHRRKGLWEAMLSMRQFLASGRGIQCTLLSTASNGIIDKYDESLNYLTYIKK
jgi:hypothetical protein